MTTEDDNSKTRQCSIPITDLIRYLQLSNQTFYSVQLNPSAEHDRIRTLENILSTLDDEYEGTLTAANTIWQELGFTQNQFGNHFIYGKFTTYPNATEFLLICAYSQTPEKDQTLPLFLFIGDVDDDDDEDISCIIPLHIFSRTGQEQDGTTYMEFADLETSEDVTFHLTYAQAPLLAVLANIDFDHRKAASQLEHAPFDDIYAPLKHHMETRTTESLNRDIKNLQRHGNLAVAEETAPKLLSNTFKAEAESNPRAPDNENILDDLKSGIIPLETLHSMLKIDMIPFSQTGISSTNPDHQDDFKDIHEMLEIFDDPQASDFSNPENISNIQLWECSNFLGAQVTYIEYDIESGSTENRIERKIILAIMQNEIDSEGYDVMTPYAILSGTIVPKIKDTEDHKPEKLQISYCQTYNIDPVLKDHTPTLPQALWYMDGALISLRCDLPFDAEIFESVLFAEADKLNAKMEDMLVRTTEEYLSDCNVAILEWHESSIGKGPHPYDIRFCIECAPIIQ